MAIRSFLQDLWKQNKLAFFASLYLLALLLLGIFGYLIAPDQTPNANTQIAAMASKKPGYEQLFLLLPAEVTEKASWTQVFSGKPATYTPMPIHAYRQSGDRLFVHEFIHPGAGEWKSFSIHDLTGGKTETWPSYIRKKTFHLGTDGLGRDILSRLIIGTRVSLTVGFMGMFISLIIGFLIGALGALGSPKTDSLVQWFLGVFWSIPTILLVFAMTLAFGKGNMQIYGAIGCTLWVQIARVTRSQLMSLREREYIQAVTLMGFSKVRILFRHLLPNMTGTLLVLGTANFASAIMIEAGLSFLGLGIQAPQPSWGLMIKEHYSYLITNKPEMALIPGLAIVSLVLAVHLLGSAFRDRWDFRNA